MCKVKGYTFDFMRFFFFILFHTMKRGEKMAEVWIVFCLILVIIELATVNLVSIWFAFGALVASIASIFTDQIIIQVGVFVVTSILAFLAIRPLAHKYILPKVEKTNLDRVVGKIGLVTEPITRLEPGEVKVDGKRWSAIANKKIKKDSKVEILAIDGVKLVVKEIKEEEEK